MAFRFRLFEHAAVLAATLGQPLAATRAPDAGRPQRSAYKRTSPAYPYSSKRQDERNRRRYLGREKHHSYK